MHTTVLQYKKTEIGLQEHATFPPSERIHLSAKDILTVGRLLEHTSVQTPLCIRTQGLEPVPQQLYLSLGDLVK